MVLDQLPVSKIKCTYPISESWVSKNYQLIYNTGGSRAIELLGNSQKLSNGQLLLLLPSHQILIEGKLDELRIISFQSKFLDLYIETETPLEAEGIVLNKNTRKSFDLVWDSKADHSDNRTCVTNSCHVFMLINKLLFPKTLCVEKQSERKVVAHQVCGLNIIFAARFIRKNISNSDLSLVEIAQSVNYHPNYFCSEFKKAMSITPMKYVAQTRLNLALLLLSTTNYSIKTICKKIGIRDISYFRAFMKRNVGLTPLELRRNHKLNLIMNQKPDH